MEKNKYGEDVELQGPVCSVCKQRVGVWESYVTVNSRVICHHCIKEKTHFVISANKKEQK